MKKIRLASMFAGCGGTDIGFTGGFYYLSTKFKKLPVKLVFANDNDEKTCDIFDLNFPVKITRGDIKKIRAQDIPDHEILTAGFPCQSFSIVAQNPPRLGVKDPTGNLYSEVCKVLKIKKPLCFVAENVKGILSANKGLAFPLIMKSFRQCKYHVVHMLLNSNDYGVPQKRERVFMVGFKNAKYMDMFKPPSPSAERNVLRSVLFDESEIDPKYYFSKRALAGLKKAKKEMNKGRAQNLDGPCNTVGAHLAKVSINSTDPVIKINGKYRRFTPREVARIQSFPESYQLCGSDGSQYRALGNAIPPVLAWHVANSVIEAIHRAEKIQNLEFV